MPLFSDCKPHQNLGFLQVDLLDSLDSLDSKIDVSYVCAGAGAVAYMPRNVDSGIQRKAYLGWDKHVSHYTEIVNCDGNRSGYRRVRGKELQTSLECNYQPLGGLSRMDPLVPSGINSIPTCGR